MTTPGDPLITLGEALNRYTTLQDAMKEHANKLDNEPLPDIQYPLPPLESPNGPVSP